MMRVLAIVFPLALVAIAAVAAAAGHEEPSPPHSFATVTGGSFGIENSRNDTSIFEASGIGPGDGTSGTVKIANDGDEAGELRLGQHDVADTPGAGGGLLSRGMSMRIREVSDPAEPALVYDGVLAPMPALELGPLEPGQSRVFEFDASLPDNGPPAGATVGDNAFQAAAVSVGYSWTAVELPPTPAAAPRSTPSPTGPVGAPAGHSVQLTILRIRAAIWHRHLVLWAYCGPGTCRVLAQLRFKAHRSARSPGRAIGSLHQERLVAGSRKLVFRLSPLLRRTLRAVVSGGEKATVSVVLVLANHEAEPLTARDAVRLRHLHPGARHGRR